VNDTCWLPFSIVCFDSSILCYCFHLYFALSGFGLLTCFLTSLFGYFLRNSFSHQHDVTLILILTLFLAKTIQTLTTRPLTTILRRLQIVRPNSAFWLSFIIEEFPWVSRFAPLFCFCTVLPLFPKSSLDFASLSFEGSFSFILFLPLDHNTTVLVSSKLLFLFLSLISFSILLSQIFSLSHLYSLVILSGLIRPLCYWFLDPDLILNYYLSLSQSWKTFINLHQASTLEDLHYAFIIKEQGVHMGTFQSFSMSWKRSRVHGWTQRIQPAKHKRQ